MPREARGDEVEKAPMSAEARRWWPGFMPRDEGGRRDELEASGVLLRLPMLWLDDMVVWSTAERNVVVVANSKYYQLTENLQFLLSSKASGRSFVLDASYRAQTSQKEKKRTEATMSLG